MRREIIAAASVLALMTGAAVAQTTSPQTTTPQAVPPATGNAATGGPTATDMNQTGQAQRNMTQSGPTGGQVASVEELMGKNVYGKDNEKVGEVEDIILNSNGQASQLVIASGGFLGIGEKKVAVDYNDAQWDQGQNRIHLSGLSRDDVKNMPEFTYSDTTVSLSRNKERSGATSNDAASRSSTGTTAAPGAPMGAPATPTDRSGQ